MKSRSIHEHLDSTLGFLKTSMILLWTIHMEELAHVSVH